MAVYYGVVMHTYKKLKCRGNVIIKDNCVIKSRDHLCSPNLAKNLVAKELAELRETVKNNTDPVPTLYNKTKAKLQDMGLDLITEVPPLMNIQQNLYKIRNQNFGLHKMVYTNFEEFSVFNMCHVDCSNVNKFHTYLYLLFFNFCVRIYADIFTAVVDLEHLLATQTKVIDDFNIYVDMQEKKLDAMRGYLHLYAKEYTKATRNASNYLTNPINAFILTKRLTVDLNYMNILIKKGSASEDLRNILEDHENNVYPKNDDLIGATQALYRLQITYNLNVKDLAHGNLNHITYSSPMTAMDCYEIGKILMIETNYVETAHEWMVEAYSKYSVETNSWPLQVVDMLKHINCNILNNLAAAKQELQHAPKIIEANEKDSEVDEREENSDETKEFSLNQFVTNWTGQEQEQQEEVSWPDFDKYAALCRGELMLPIKKSSRLTCRYLTEKHPFLKLAPFKMEILYFNPDVLLFHDVLTDGEIETVKQIGRPSLERAMVFDDNDNTQEIVASYRISKAAWLLDEDSETISRISRRVSDMTDLNVDTAEALQLCNYGIGGFYAPHFDFDSESAESAMTEEERIATVLFYMSDVTQGGATVFPHLDLTVYPKKGAAIFWFNLHLSGIGNSATRHAACPVLQGDKWVSTKWIQQHGQEFLRPCDLNHNKEVSIIDSLHPIPKTV